MTWSQFSLSCQTESSYHLSHPELEVLWFQRRCQCAAELAVGHHFHSNKPWRRECWEKVPQSDINHEVVSGSEPVVLIPFKLRKRLVQSRSILSSKADSELWRISFHLFHMASNISQTWVISDAASSGGDLHLGVLPFPRAFGGTHSFEIDSLHCKWWKPRRIASIPKVSWHSMAACTNGDSFPK